MPCLLTPSLHKYLAMSLAALLLASCSLGEDGDSVAVVFMQDDEGSTGTGSGSSTTERNIHAATTEGLVAFDANGDIIPALAERWIVTDDAQSYIFRLRNSDWPDEQPLTGGNVASELQRTMAGLDGTALGLDVAIISEIRAMAGRVVEIRLKSPMPEFLRLLAQPELGLQRGGEGGMGPMGVRQAKIDNTVIQSLFVLAPERRGLPERRQWEDEVRVLRVRTLPDKQALERFYAGSADVVLNGRYSSFPLVDTGPLSRGTVRLDPALGLFGLRVRNERGILSSASLREAVAMAIDRETLLASFPVGGWLPETRLVPNTVLGESPVEPRWNGLSIEQRRAQATQRISGWRRANGGTASLSVYLPAGSGSEQLFNGLRSDFKSVGIELSRANSSDKADLELVDRVATYAGQRWFLNQLNCAVENAPCSPEADALVAHAVETRDGAEQADLLGQAARVLDSSNVYIPLGTPIRWSLIRGGLTGYEANGWAVHPLFPMAQRPI